MHQYDSKNFIFLKKTSLEHLYQTLEDNELICYRKPTNEKIYIDARRIVEELVKQIMDKKGLIEEEMLSRNLNSLRRKLPIEIYEKFNQIRKVGNSYAHFTEETMLIEPVEILKMLHECLRWYVRTWEGVICTETAFQMPIGMSEVEDKKREARINQIKEAYEKESAQLKREYKAAQDNLRCTQVRLQAVQKQNEAMEEKIKAQNEKLRNTNKGYKTAQQEVAELKWTLEHNNEKVLALQSRLEQLEASLQEEEESKAESLSLHEIEALNEQILAETNACEKEVVQTGKRLKTMSEIFNSSNIEGVHYEAFYQGFLSLEGSQLRMVYAMLTKLNLYSLTKAVIGNQVNKLRSAQLDEVEKFLKKEVIHLSDIHDEEIKLRLYYRLLKICRIDEGTLSQEEKFKQHLDTIVTYGYKTLSKQNDFEQGENKLQSIITYYMQKIFKDFEERFNSADAKTQEELVGQIYNSFENLPDEERQRIYDKIGIKDRSEQSIKTVIITLGPAAILSTLVSIGGFGAYIALSSLIHAVSTLLGVTFSFSVYTGAASLLSFFAGPFMIVLLLGQGVLLYSSVEKQQQSLVPLIIMQIVTNEACFKEERNDETNYQKLVAHWQGKKQIYDRMLQKQDTMQSIIDGLNSRKAELVAIQEENQQEKAQTLAKKDAELQSVRPIVVKHTSVVTLISYTDYAAIRNNILANEIKKTAAPQGFLKNILHKSTTGFTSLNLNHKLRECEKRLVEEARTCALFEEETKSLNAHYTRLEQIENILGEAEEEMAKVKGQIRKQEEKIGSLKCEMKEFLKVYSDLKNVEA